MSFTNTVVGKTTSKAFTMGTWMGREGGRWKKVRKSIDQMAGVVMCNNLSSFHRKPGSNHDLSSSWGISSAQANKRNVANACL